MENLSNMLRERRKIQIWFHVHEVSKQAKLIVMIEVRVEVASGGMGEHSKMMGMFCIMI